VEAATPSERSSSRVDEPLLAIDGALRSFSVAILTESVAVAEQLDGHDALERGLSLLRETLDRAQLTLAALRGIAVGIGPGGFTGLRIAIAFAKSLALGRGLPLTGVSSFDILDRAAAAESAFPRLTVVYGRTGIACIRRSERDGSRVACGPAGATAARLLGKETSLTLVGATEDVLSVALEREKSVHVAPLPNEPPALTLARIARERAPAPSIHAVAPDYGELPAARLQKR